jgi:hypothetical protein
MTGGPETYAITVDARLVAQAAELLDACRARGETIVTAESCTGGLVAATLTAVPGSSDVFERGFVTYANVAKSEMLGVPYWLIERHGAVSESRRRRHRYRRTRRRHAREARGTCLLRRGAARLSDHR